MSTHFRPLTPIRMADLFDGRLKDVGVHELHTEDAPTNVKCLTDGSSDLWVEGDEEGRASWLVSYGANDVFHILKAISAAFDVDIEIVDLDIEMGDRVPEDDEPRAILRAPSRRRIEVRDGDG